MLEKEEGKIDAVLVGTPDHCHAPAAAMALRMKKHVYCEKPLTHHTVYEARTLANLAKENNLVTQMGTQIHAGNNYRRVVELVQSGAIGDVKRVHVWVPAVYNQGVFKPDRKAGQCRLGFVARPGSRTTLTPPTFIRSNGVTSGTSAPAAWVTSAVTTWTSCIGRSTCAAPKR